MASVIVFVSGREVTYCLLAKSLGRKLKLLFGHLIEKLNCRAALQCHPRSGSSRNSYNYFDLGARSPGQLQSDVSPPPVSSRTAPLVYFSISGRYT